MPWLWQVSQNQLFIGYYIIKRRCKIILYFLEVLKFHMNFSLSLSLKLNYICSRFLDFLIVSDVWIILWNGRRKSRNNKGTPWDISISGDQAHTVAHHLFSRIQHWVPWIGETSPIWCRKMGEGLWILERSIIFIFVNVQINYINFIEQVIFERGTHFIVSFLVVDFNWFCSHDSLSWLST